MANNTYRSDYEVTRLIASSISFLGWAIFIGGVVLALMGMSSGAPMCLRFVFSLLPALGVAITGLFLVVAGQVTRATVDSADHTREILSIIKEKT